jgi:hypothetical protein
VARANLEAVPVRAYGDLDDHFRLVVLLAEAAAGGQPRLKQSEPYRTCLSRESAWDTRTEALWELIEERARRSREGAVAEVIDVDALDPGTTTAYELWDDRFFSRQRRALLGQVLTAVTQGRIAVRRVWPTSRHVTSALDDSSTTMPGGNAVSTSARKIRDWLCREGHLSLEDVAQFASAMPDIELDRHLVAIAYDVLPHTAREAVKRISLLRGPQALNGHIGPLQLGPHAGVTQEGVQVLAECGFLSSSLSAPGVELPRVVRDHVSPLAMMAHPDELRADHRRIGDLEVSDKSIEEQLEIHHHAVVGGDVERAKATGRYYLGDLRELAFQLSIEGDYAAAADLYCYLTQVDDEDAYAWEYYAYNLARDSGFEELDEVAAAKIRAGYERAHLLERDNPLYHGRFLGFRALRAEEIVPDFSKGIARYLGPNFPAEAASFFAKPVLEALDYAGHQGMKARILDRWRSELIRFDRLKPLCG